MTFDLTCSLHSTLIQKESPHQSFSFTHNYGQIMIKKIGRQQLITYPVCHTAFPSAYSVGEQDQEYAHGCIGNILENK